MDYKIIVLDLDGTLTNRDKIITPRTKEALMNAQEAGNVVVLASGRPTAGVEPLARELELSRFGSPFIKEMLEIPSYYQRDYYICKLLVAEGKISEENAKKLNHIICTLFLGYFKFVQEHGISQDEIPELVNQFIQESKEITQCYAYDFTPK